MHPIYVGYDAREHIAFEVLKSSILTHNPDSQILPLAHSSLRKRGIFRRPWLVESNTGRKIDLIDGRPFSTEFSHSRFLVPYLCNFSGWALFIDCDMLCTRDINAIFDLTRDEYAIMVVKQNHCPTSETKMDQQVQSTYPRKNWSSVVLWNCAHDANKTLNPEFVSVASGANLHQFTWLQDSDIGDISPEWNWIQGTTSDSIEPALIHYTEGGPWFEGHEKVKFGELWIQEYARWLASEQKRVLGLLG
jgi:lipopolysaccharide biosynthesis glycosyltransferase